MEELEIVLEQESFDEIEILLKHEGTDVYPELEDLKIEPSNAEQIFRSDKYGYNEVKISAVTIKEHYLEGKNIILVLNDNSKLSIDISSYIDGGLTEKEIEAINDMTISIVDGELIFEYDNETLNVDFSIEDNNLIVTNNVTGLDFSINENELEAIY